MEKRKEGKLTNKLIFLTTTGYYNVQGWGSKWAANGLHNMQNFIPSSNSVTNVLTTIKWWIIRLVYNLANASSEILNKMLGTKSFITDAINKHTGFGKWIPAAQKAAGAILLLALLWAMLKIIVDHHAPQIKGVISQTVVSFLIIVFMGPLTSWMVNLSVGQYNDAVQTEKNSKGTSSLPFEVLRSNTNDTEYLISHNFKPDSKSANKTSIAGAGDYTKVRTPPKVKYGYNNLTSSQIDHNDVSLNQIIDWNDVDSHMPLWQMDRDLKHPDSKKGRYFLFSWLMHHPKQTEDINGKTKWFAPDINRLGGTGDSATIYSFGGYERYNIDFWPTVITLVALAFAFFFAAYAIVKSFIEIGIMQILGVFVVATDVESGSRAKQVVQKICNLSMLVGIQGIEIAFYKVAMLWAANAKNTKVFGSGAVADWSFVVFAIAATTMVIVGSQQVTEFFGIDTGAQHGLKSAMMLANGASVAGQNLKKPFTAAKKVGSKAGGKLGDLSKKLNPEGALKKEAAEEDAKNRHKAAAEQFMKTKGNAGDSGQEPRRNENGQPKTVGDFVNDDEPKAAKDSEEPAQTDNENLRSDAQRRPDKSENSARENSVEEKQTKPRQETTQAADTGAAVATETEIANKAKTVGQSNNNTQAVSKLSDSNSDVSGSSKGGSASVQGQLGARSIDSPKTQALRRQLSTDQKKFQNMNKAPERYSINEMQKQDDLVQNDRTQLRQSQLDDRQQFNDQQAKTNISRPKVNEWQNQHQAKPTSPKETSINSNLKKSARPAKQPVVDPPRYGNEPDRPNQFK